MSETIDFDGGVSSIRKQYDYNGTLQEFINLKGIYFQMS